MQGPAVDCGQIGRRKFDWIVPWYLNHVVELLPILVIVYDDPMLMTVFEDQMF